MREINIVIINIRILAYILIVSFLSCLQVQAFNRKELSNPDPASHKGINILQDLPLELFSLFCDDLPKRDLNNLRLACRKSSVLVSGYKVALINRLMAQVNAFTPSMSAHGIFHALSVTVENDPNLKRSFIKMLYDKMKEKSFLFVTSSPLVPYLHKQPFAKLDEDDFLQNLDVAGELYLALFNRPLPTDR